MAGLAGPEPVPVVMLGPERSVRRVVTLWAVPVRTDPMLRTDVIVAQRSMHLVSD